MVMQSKKRQNIAVYLTTKPVEQKKVTNIYEVVGGCVHNDMFIHRQKDIARPVAKNRMSPSTTQHALGHTRLLSFKNPTYAINYQNIYYMHYTTEPFCAQNAQEG